MSIYLVPLEDWTEQAVCVQYPPDLFFPSRDGSPRPAKQVCAGCPVRQPCLEFAMETGQVSGVWGGTSEYQRRELRRKALRQQEVAA